MKRPLWIPWLTALVAAGALAWWLWLGPAARFGARLPGTDQGPDGTGGSNSNPVLSGKVVRGEGTPATLAGAWPQFRGPERDGRSRETNRLARTWPVSGPRTLWSVEVGEGYAGPAVRAGRVYLMDYDREKKQSALRCLSLGDGREIWRFAYPLSVKRNHGMSRTIPAVSERLVVGLDPKCHAMCLNATNGNLRWGLDLVREFGATVPPWYAGQCPLLDGDAVILAPGGPDALLASVDAETAHVRWRTPNPNGWKMTHSSIMPMDWEGERMYLYCANNGAVGVSAKDGSLRWQTGEWKISFATVPSPLVLPDGRIFLSGGYDAGSLMLRLRKTDGRVVVETVFRLRPEVFGATQQTPILDGDHIYGVRPDGHFVCLDLDGKPVWTSEGLPSLGLGSFVSGDGLIFALNDSGRLHAIEVNPREFKLRAQADVIQGREAWGPPALAGGRLLLRDLTKLVCLDVAEP